MDKTARVYNIPSTQPFGRTLAAGLLQMRDNDPAAFSKALILLPTRRACRTLREAFLKLTNGAPLLLPRIQPLGEVDEEELSLWLGAKGNDDALIHIPPAISPLRRKLLLSRLIQAQESAAASPRQALMLADALGAFIDQLIIEELDFNRLHEIVPDEFAGHWQITIKFLKIISEVWPQILAEQGLIEMAERRARLMDMLGTFWEQNPPDYPLIAGGSTGSHPATARLMARIAKLPQGQVILPGLDPYIDEESWSSLDPSHPQYGLKQLLNVIGIHRKDVGNWHNISLSDTPVWRAKLATEIMRPAETSSAWQNLRTIYKRRDIERALDGLKIANCSSSQHEAQTIALALRQALEEPNKTAILITPDRTLARRVAGICKRWDIALNDSSGQPLSKSTAGLFLRLAIETITANFKPVPLLALLKHPYCRLGIAMADRTKAIHALEASLRGLAPNAGLNGIHQRIQEWKESEKELIETPELENILNRLEKAAEPILTQNKNKVESNIYDSMTLLVHFIEALFEPPEDNSISTFWQDEDGEALATLLINLQQEGSALEHHSLDEFFEIVLTLIEGVSVRSKYGAHPRLAILGQLEARMVDADLVILGGLNEGVWPSDPGHDPWMSRPMRNEFGLPPQERSISLAAHDFVQAFSQRSVLITRTEMSDGAPTLPSRWLSRLQAVLGSFDDALYLQIQETKLTHLAEWMDRAEHTVPATRPAPVPKPQHKPKRLSVTKIETLLKDPYAIYAGSILKLHKLDPLEKQVDAAERGTLLHAILERFIRQYPDVLPADIAGTLKTIAEEELTNFNDNSDFQRYWRSRFETLSAWLEKHERSWRQNAKPKKLEADGALRITLDNGAEFTLSGRADRIDTMRDGSGYAIIDYKSGGTYSQKSMINGDKPQLLLEALMIESGAFEDLPAGDTAQVAYWKLSGGHTAGAITNFTRDDKKEDLEAAITETGDFLIALLDRFITRDDTPFICQPRSRLAPAYDDYEHLSRKQEWSADGNEEEAA